MSKKIYDIKPPKIVHKEKNSAKNPVGGAKIKKHTKKNDSLHKKRIFPLKEVLVGSSIIVFLLGIYFYNKLPRANILISPKLESLTLQEKITTDKTINIIDLSGKVIPAQFIEQVEESWQEFQATGSTSNDSKASGTVKIYNKISPSTPFTLKTGTHFLSDSGKYFVTLEKVTIPAAKNKTPGSITVKVQAEEPGTDYNIGPANFSVPKLSGTIYYYSIWAESDDNMTGGYTGTLKKVTKDDISQAKESLTKKLLSKAENSLKSKISPEDVLLDGAISREIISSSSDIKVDSIIDKFNQSAKVKVSALVFKKQDLEKFSKDYILSQLSDSENFLEKSLDIKYSPELIDIKKGAEIINLQLFFKKYHNINEVDLTDLVFRKSSQEIKDIVDGKYKDKVSKVEVDFWPFWVHKTPADKNRVKIELVFE